MASRRHYQAVVTDDATGETIGTAQTYAWNSANRGAVALVREIARRERRLYARGAASITDGVGVQQWHADAGHPRTLTITTREVAP